MTAVALSSTPIKASPPKTAPEPGTTVLVVDDKEVNRRLIRRIISKEGHRVLEADSGRAAIDILRAERVDAVVLDVNMPGMSGIEVVRVANADPALAGIPIIIVTAAANPELRFEALEAGAADFLPKPFDQAELKARLRNLIRLKVLSTEAVAHHERMKAVLTAVGEALVVCSPAGLVIDANRAAEDLLTPEGGVLLGTPIEDLRNSDVRHLLQETLRTRGEVEVRKFSVDDAAFEAQAALVSEAEGDDVGAVVVIRDVTHLREIDRVKDELLATVNHELRTPLTSLRGFAELMLDREVSPEDRREFLGIILRETERLTNLINDFLDIQRIEAGHMGCKLERVDNVEAVLRDAVASICRADGGRDVQVAIESPLASVSADRDRLHQVVTNLLSNAVKFSPEGGTITLRARADAEEITVSIQDQGIGIPPDAITKLFSRFYRVDNRATRTIGGSGLGLALVKQLVERHQGRVGVTSELGEGSTFFFTLPLL